MDDTYQQTQLLLAWVWLVIIFALFVNTELSQSNLVASSRKIILMRLSTLTYVRSSGRACVEFTTMWQTFDGGNGCLWLLRWCCSFSTPLWLRSSFCLLSQENGNSWAYLPDKWEGNVLQLSLHCQNGIHGRELDIYTAKPAYRQFLHHPKVYPKLDWFLTLFPHLSSNLHHV